MSPQLSSHSFWSPQVGCHRPSHSKHMPQFPRSFKLRSNSQSWWLAQGTAERHSKAVELSHQMPNQRVWSLLGCLKPSYSSSTQVPQLIQVQIQLCQALIHTEGGSQVFTGSSSDLANLQLQDPQPMTGCLKLNRKASDPNPPVHLVLSKEAVSCQATTSRGHFLN